MIPVLQYVLLKCVYYIWQAWDSLYLLLFNYILLAIHMNVYTATCQVIMLYRWCFQRCFVASEWNLNSIKVKRSTGVDRNWMLRSDLSKCTNGKDAQGVTVSGLWETSISRDSWKKIKIWKLHCLKRACFKGWKCIQWFSYKILF